MNSDDCPQQLLACCGSRKDARGQPDVSVHECWSGRWDNAQEDQATLEPLLPHPVGEAAEEDRRLAGHAVPGPLALQTVINFVNSREDCWNEWLQSEQEWTYERHASRASTPPQLPRLRTLQQTSSSPRSQPSGRRPAQDGSPPAVRCRSSPALGSESRHQPVLLMTPYSMTTDLSRGSDLSTKLPLEGRVSLITPMSMETVTSSKQRNVRSSEVGPGVDLLTPMSMATVVDRGSGQDASAPRPAGQSVIEVQTPPSVDTDVCPGAPDSATSPQVSGVSGNETAVRSTEEGVSWPVTRLFR